MKYTAAFIGVPILCGALDAYVAGAGFWVLLILMFLAGGIFTAEELHGAYCAHMNQKRMAKLHGSIKKS